MTVDLCEALKSATKEAHERAENTQLMRSFQNSQISLEHFKLLLESLYCIYVALEEEMERNREHPALTALYFPGELERVSALEADLCYLHGEGWREVLRCPPATSDYVKRLRHVGSERPELLGAHAYTRYMGDLSGGQVLRKLAQKALGLPTSGQGTAFFTFPNISSLNGFKQLYRSRLDSLELSQQTRQQVLDEANRAFQLNVEVFEELQRLGSKAQDNGPVVNGSVSGDLSEALKKATAVSHAQAESTEFMSNFQRGQVTPEKFKLLLESLYCIYVALEEEMERNREHPALTALYFPGELERVSALEADLCYLHGEGWREVLRCPPATSDYVKRLRHVGSERPELLGAHAYTRYMGDLSGGQVLRKLAQKALGLPASGQGTAFFTFPNISSLNGFKQLYRSRLDSLELSQQTRQQVLDEANRAFQLNVEVFEELQRLGTSAQQNGSSGTEGGAEIRQRIISRPLGDATVRGEQAMTESQSWPVAVAVLTAAVLIAAFLWFSL